MAAAQTLQILKYPHRHYEQVVERVSPRGLVLHRAVSVEIEPPRLAESQITRFSVPLLSPPRRQLLSNLKVIDSRGERLRTLHHSEHLAHESRMIWLEMLRAGISQPSDRSGDARALYDSVVNFSRFTQSQAEVILGFFRADQLCFGAHRGEDEVAEIYDLWNRVRISRGLMFLLRLLTYHYIVIAECVPASDGKIFLEYEYDAPYGRNDFESSKLARDRVRRRFGIRSPNYVFYLGLLPVLATSYHFYMDAPRGYYVSRSRFLTLDRALSVTDTEDIRMRQLSEMQQLNGEMVLTGPAPGNVPFAHMYTADCERYGTTIFASLTTHELPPGATGLALGVAIMAIAPLVAIAAIFNHLFETGSQIGADVPALLLAVPAIAFGALSLRRDRGTLTAVPLFAYLGLLFTSLFSLWAALDLVITGALKKVVLIHWASRPVSTLHLGRCVFIGYAVAQCALAYVLYVRNQMAIGYARKRNDLSAFFVPHRLVIQSIRSCRNVARRARRRLRGTVRLTTRRWRRSMKR